MVFATDVTHALRTAHLTVYVYCNCGCRHTQINPRLQRLELDPVVAVRSCTFARLGQPSAGAGELAMRLAEKESQLRAEREMDSYQELYEEFTKKLSSPNAAIIEFKNNLDDIAAIRRLWKICRLNFKILVRTPRAEWNSTHAGLSQLLRRWCAVGQVATTTLLAEMPPIPALHKDALQSAALQSAALQHEMHSTSEMHLTPEMHSTPELRHILHDLQIAFTATKVTAVELWG
jgi:hypothetical protein